MHLAPFARRVVIGLPVVACCFAVLPVASAWELFSGSGAASRPAANSVDTGNPNVDASTRRGPLFHGQEIKWPTMPFARSKPKPKTSPHRSYNNTSRPAPNASGQTASRFGGTTAARTPRSPQPMSHHPSAVPNRPYHHGAPAQARAERTALNASSTAADARTAPRGPTLAPTESHRTPVAAATAAADSPADRLIAQAHGWSGSAQTDADYTRIIEACRQARAGQPSPVARRYAAELASWAFNRRGQLKAEAGQHQEALVDFNDAVRADAQRWLACHNRGVLLAQSGEFERAFDDFTRTIQLNPKFAKAYSNRAALHLVAGDIEAALQDYRQAVELEPELAVAQRGCGRAYHLQRRLNDALRHYDEAVRLAPGDAYAITSRADLLTDLGRYAEAATEYERSIKLDPNSDQACSSSAWLLATCPDASVRNPALAIERAKLAIELTGQQDAVNFDTLAAAQASAGDFSAATEAMRQAVHLASDETREVYEQRLLMYQQSKPYRIAPVGEVIQASYETGSREQGAGSRE